MSFHINGRPVQSQIVYRVVGGEGVEEVNAFLDPDTDKLFYLNANHTKNEISIVLGQGWHKSRSEAEQQFARATDAFNHLVLPHIDFNNVE